MPTRHAGIMTADPRDFEAGGRRPRAEAEPLWLRWLRRLVGATRRLSTRRLAASQSREPIFRIAREWRGRWVVQPPGAVLDHPCPDLERAVAFVRHESGAMPAVVELRIGDLYVVAHLDPSQPGSLFGEAGP